MEPSPEEQASGKLAQHLVVAVQIAESVMRLRQQQIGREAARDNTAAGAARAERVAQHAADRLVWSPALDRDWLDRADLHDLGKAWGAATGWADTDPTADAAARRVESRLSDVAPSAMARFDELRETGWTRTDAMTDVLADVAAQAHTAATERRVFVADAAPARAADDVIRADAQARADTSALLALGSEATPDNRATASIDEHAEGLQAALPLRDEQDAWRADADATNQEPNSTVDAFAHRRVLDDGAPHPADVAADSHPNPFVDVTPPASHPRPPAAAAPTPAVRTRTLSR